MVTAITALGITSGYTNSQYRSTRSRKAGQVLLALFPHYFSEEVVP